MHFSLLTIFDVAYWLLIVTGYGFVVVAWGGIAFAIALMVSDRRRQGVIPKRHAYSSSPLFSKYLLTLPRQQAPICSKSETEPVAYLDQVIHLMKTGDILNFSGCRLHSYVNRIVRWCLSSHSAMVYVDSNEQRWVAEVIERFAIVWHGWKPSIDLGGFRLVRIENYVAKYPGQLYWARIADIYAEPSYTVDGKVIPPRFNRLKAAAAIEASKSLGYGWGCIGLQIVQQVVIVREIVYLRTWRNLNKNWAATHSPDCSCIVSLWCEAAGEDPVPGLAAQLTTPAEIERTKLTEEGVALVP